MRPNRPLHPLRLETERRERQLELRLQQTIRDLLIYALFLSLTLAAGFATFGNPSLERQNKLFQILLQTKMNKSFQVSLVDVISLHAKYETFNQLLDMERRPSKMAVIINS